MQTFILTNYETYTDAEVVDLFSEHIKPENLEVLVKHLTYPELAEHILSFTEIEGEVHFNLGNGEELIRVSKKESIQ